MRTAHDSNLFIEFKRLVDRGWDALTLKHSRRALDNPQRGHGETPNRRWARRSSDPDSIMQPTTREEAVEATSLLLRLAESRTLDVPPSKLQALFHDSESTPNSHLASNRDAMLAFGGACYFLPEIGDRLPSSADLCRPSNSNPQWLTIDWFKKSPYSPLQVEFEAALPGPPWNPSWRAAFEDLVTVSMGRPMPSEESLSRPYGTEPGRLQPGIDWVINLQVQGILPPLLPSLYSSASTRASRDQGFHKIVDEIWKSDRAYPALMACWIEFKSNYRPLPNPDIDIAPASPAAIQVSAGRLAEERTQRPQPGVQSTVKVVKTSRTADGEVTTKTVVRHCYEDGTDEELESVHTFNESDVPIGES